MTKKSRLKERRRAQRRRRRLYWIGGIAAAAVIVAAILIVPNLQGPGEIAAPEPFDWPNGEATAMGDPQAPVTITEFSDFQCPFCRRFHEETLPTIVNKHVRTGEVYFVYMNFPFIGQESLEAANAALCAADQGEFWTYSSYLFANQRGEGVGSFTEARLQAMAQEIELEMDSFEQCSSRNEKRPQVQEQYAQGLEMGVDSTPAFFVNGEMILGAEPYSVFQQAIQETLEEGQE